MLFILVMISYVNALNCGFVWDDWNQIVYNPFVTSIKNAPLIFTTANHATFPHQLSAVYYRPLQVLTYITDYVIWKLRPAGFHLTNILLHYLVSLLLFVLLCHVSRKKLLALFVSCLFAVHPLNTSAVSYIAGRAEMLVTICMCASFILWIKSGPHFNRPYAGSLVFYILALFSKESAIVFPLILLAHAAIFFSSDRKTFSKACIKMVPFVFTLLIYLIARGYILDNISIPSFHLSPGVSLLTACSIVVLYIKMLLVPVNLHMGHSALIVRNLIDPSLLLCMAGIGLFLSLGRMIYRHAKESLFFSCWFVIFLFPVFFLMHADHTGHVLMAEHWVYTASSGFYFITASIFVFLTGKIRNASRRALAMSIAAGLSLSIYMVITVNANRNWENDFTVCRQAIGSPHPDRFYNWKAYNNIGKIYEDGKEYLKARLMYQKALSLALQEGHRCVSARMCCSLANVDCFEGKYGRAAAGYQQGLKLCPVLDSCYAGLGYALIMLERKDEALMVLQKALQLNPMSAEARYNLSVLRDAEGDNVLRKK